MKETMIEEIEQLNVEINQELDQETKWIKKITHMEQYIRNGDLYEHQ